MMYLTLFIAVPFALYLWGGMIWGAVRALLED